MLTLQDREKNRAKELIEDFCRGNQATVSFLKEKVPSFRRACALPNVAADYEVAARWASIPTEPTRVARVFPRQASQQTPSDSRSSQPS